MSYYQENTCPKCSTVHGRKEIDGFKFDELLEEHAGNIGEDGRNSHYKDGDDETIAIEKTCENCVNKS